MVAQRPTVKGQCHRLSVLVALLVAGCAFEAGEPIGRLSPSLSVALDLGEGRVVDGRWLTSTDYAIALSSFEVAVRSLSIGLTSSGAATTVAFDPSSPPEGYGLCHGGHCHADDGRLVTYEDIEAELAREGLEPEHLLTVPVSGGLASLEIDSGQVPVALGDCPERCAVTTSRLVSATVALDVARVSMRVYDRRVGDGARLPPEGLSLDVDVAIGAAVKARLTGEFGPDEPAETALHATLLVDDSVFDGVDFGGLVLTDMGGEATSAMAEALSSALASSMLTVVVTPL